MGGYNLVAFVENTPVKVIDVLGFWSLIFKGGWSPSERDAVNAAFNSLKTNIPSYLSRLSLWMAAAATLPDDCAYKRRFQQELTALSAVFKGMESGLNSSDPLKIYKKDLGTGTEARVIFDLWDNFKGKMHLNTNSSDPFTEWNTSKMLNTVFHEMSRVAGVPGDENETGWWHDNAHNVDDLANDPSNYTLVPIVSFIQFNIGLGDTCCPKLSEWIP